MPLSLRTLVKKWLGQPPAPTPQPEADAPKTLDEPSVRATLRGLLDPDLGLEIVELGMVRNVTIEGENVRIVLTPTSPLCPLADVMMADIIERVKAVFPASQVEVTISHDPPWNASMMSPSAKEALGWKG